MDQIIAHDMSPAYLSANRFSQRTVGYRLQTRPINFSSEAIIWLMIARALATRQKF